MNTPPTIEQPDTVMVHSLPHHEMNTPIIEQPGGEAIETPIKSRSNRRRKYVGIAVETVGPVEPVEAKDDDIV